MELSVVIITKDEAANIEDCLESVRWATELIVVDSHSTDDTAAIARDLGARVFDEDWKGYARQKNSAIAKANCPWILSVDADERVTASLRTEIEEVIRDQAALNGYQIPRKNFFCGRWIRHGGWSPDYTLRLFRKGRGNFEERTVHERLIVEGQVGRLNSPLLHYTYDSVSSFLERQNRYSRLAAQEISRRASWTRWHTLTLRPLYTFFSMYFLRLGCLDGFPGLFLAVSYAYYTFLKYYRYFNPEIGVSRLGQEKDSTRI